MPVGPSATSVPSASSTAEIEAGIRHLSGIERGSASGGERKAAEWIAARLREEGCGSARVEAEPAHGTYWWPLGTLSSLTVALGLWALRHPGRARAPIVALGALAAWAMGDDVSAGRFWFRKRFLPRRTTYNVVAEAGDPAAPRTVVLVAHHDAAHTGRSSTPVSPRSATASPTDRPLRRAGLGHGARRRSSGARSLGSRAGGGGGGGGPAPPPPPPPPPPPRPRRPPPPPNRPARSPPWARSSVGSAAPSSPTWGAAVSCREPTTTRRASSRSSPSPARFASDRSRRGIREAADTDCLIPLRAGYPTR